MGVRRRTSLALAAVALMVAARAEPAAADRSTHAPTVTALTTFGSGLGSGSTIGPDGALYVTDGNAGSVLRVDPRTGATSTYATGLPRQVLGIGGAVDVAFIGRRAYVLVTMVGGDLLLPSGTTHFGDAVGGIYRLERDGRFSVVADIGAWAAAHPPTAPYFITTGVQYAMQPYGRGFLVTDGHHNRVLDVGSDGRIAALGDFADVVPTGLEAIGRHVYVAQAGPVPHRAPDARVIELSPRTGLVSPVAAGRASDTVGLAVDVERGPRGDLYVLLQGVWDLPNDPANAGSPASAGTGQLVRVTRQGTYAVVATGLDRPTSVEFLGDTALVVSLTGAILRIDHVGADERHH